MPDSLGSHRLNSRDRDGGFGLGDDGILDEADKDAD